MESKKCKSLSIVLRRFDNEAVELIPTNARMTEPQDLVAGICQIAARIGEKSEEIDTKKQDKKFENRAQVYSVMLPESLIIRPVDWRRFAYDHAKVAELISVCVIDNLGSLIFEPLSDELKASIENTLMVALNDLSSIFEIQSVRCEFSMEGRIEVTIEGEHKNGEVKNYVVETKLL